MLKDILTAKLSLEEAQNNYNKAMQENDRYFLDAWALLLPEEKNEIKQLVSNRQILNASKRLKQMLGEDIFWRSAFIHCVEVKIIDFEKQLLSSDETKFMVLDNPDYWGN